MINKILRAFVYFSGRRYMRKKYYSVLMKENGQLYKKQNDEKKWQERWKKLDRFISVLPFRIYSRYCGVNMDIMSWETLQLIVEPCLNQLEFSEYYEDKNILEKIYGKNNFPETIVRIIDGVFFDSDYNHLTKEDMFLKLEEHNNFIIKPSRDSDGGRGIEIFTKINGSFLNKNGKVFDYKYLYTLGNNIIFQKLFLQSKELAFYNKTSINTLRLVTYRSVKDESIHVLGSALRIGNKGSEVDNASAGGYFCCIDKNGNLSKEVIDFYGRKKNVFNGIDFSENVLSIPNYSRVIEFSREIAKCNIHNRLLAMDICFDINNNPKLIEVNVTNTSIQFFEYNKPLFSGFTDEIIEYCSRNYKNRIIKQINI